MTKAETKMTKHTEGPWLFDGVAQIVEARRPHMRIAFLPSDHHAYESSKFNGRLIAAAPDMSGDGAFLLDRLDEFERELDSAGTDGLTREWCGHVRPAIARFRAAIARATGE